MIVATLVGQPTTLNLVLTPRHQAERAVNQLLSVIIGSHGARATDALKTDPKARVAKCMELALAEYATAASQLAQGPEGQRAVKQVQRKMDSLGSLQILANVIDEIDWED